MAIYQACPDCRQRLALTRLKCRCGFEFDSFASGRTVRDYSIEYRYKGKPKRERLGSCTLKAAIEALHARKAAISKGDFLAAEDIPTLGEIWSEYLFSLEPANSNWLPTVRGFVARFNRIWGEKRPANTLTVRDIERFQLKLLNEGLSKTTVDRHMAAARAAWRMFPGPGENPFQKVKFYHPDNRIVESLTPEEEKSLLMTARWGYPSPGQNTWLYEMLVVAIGTGLRRGNVLALRRDEVDFRTNLITVRQKGGRKHVVLMNNSVSTILQSIPDNGSAYYWINSTTGKPYTKIGKLWKGILRKAGITRPFWWNWLRHHCASKIVSAGLGLEAARVMLGHTDNRITQRYAHLSPDYMRDVVNHTEPFHSKH